MTLQPWIEHDRRRCKNGARKDFLCPGNCGSTFTVRWRDETSETVSDKYHWDKRSEAKVRLRAVLDLNQANALGVYREITLADALQEWIRIAVPDFKTEASRQQARNIGILLSKEPLAKKILSRITYLDISQFWDARIAMGNKKSTAFKYIMTIHRVYECFKTWNGLVPDLIPQRIRLPENNPVALAKARESGTGHKMAGHSPGRKRYVTRDELRQAKAWCAENDPGLWEAMKFAIASVLRLGDQMAQEVGAQLDGIQGKTGREYKLPMVKPLLDYTNRHDRWNVLRAALGWHKTPKGLPPNPRHTTWHDLRHCGPTMLAGMGYASKIIQQILGHSTEKMSKIYTQEDMEALRPAVQALQREVDAI